MQSHWLQGAPGPRSQGELSARTSGVVSTGTQGGGPINWTLHQVSLTEHVRGCWTGLPALPPSPSHCRSQRPPWGTFFNHTSGFLGSGSIRCCSFLLSSPDPSRLTGGWCAHTHTCTAQMHSASCRVGTRAAAPDHPPFLGSTLLSWSECQPQSYFRRTLPAVKPRLLMWILKLKTVTAEERPWLL